MRVVCQARSAMSKRTSSNTQRYDDDGLAFAILEGVEEVAVGVERIYFPVAETAHEDGAAEPAERE
jgi:hypothetical protein